MSRSSSWWVLLLLSAVAASTEAADDANSAAAMYSHGVHGYFSGNLNRADLYLYRAVELSPNDPRPYYFRGLVLLRLGRTWEAGEVMQRGAAIEAHANSSAYGIGEALQRVQGADRLRLEQFRRAAKLSQINVAADNSRRRYTEHERIQAKVQRRPVRLPLDALINPVEPNQLAGLVVPEESSPAAETGAPPAVEATVDTPPEALAADEGDPFVDDPVSTTAATTPPPTAEDGAPEAAAGSVKAGSLPGIFGRILGRQLPTVDVDRFRGMVPGIGGGAAPPGMPEGFGGAVPPEADPFGTPAMPPEPGEPPTEIPAMPPTEEGENPF